MGLPENCQMVIFDFDGVIFELETDWRSLKEAVFAIADRAGINHDHGKLNQCLEALSGDDREEAIELVVAAEKVGVDRGRLMPDVKQVFEALRKRGKKIAILSRNSRKTIETVTSRFQLPGPDLIVGLEDVSKAKPDPEGLQVILEKFNLQPAEAIIVGDTSHDVNMAKLAGVFSVLLINPKLEFHPTDQADITIDPLAELVELL